MKAKKLSARPEPAPKRYRHSPHRLLFQAAAVLECARLATLYGDFHRIPYLVLSDASEVAKDLIHAALENMGDDESPAE